MEIWKDIEGFSGKYQVSNYGRVRSFAKAKNKNDYTILTGTEKKDRKPLQGYICVGLTKDHKTRAYYVHRLVAQAFIENPENKETVNHINGNKHDNRVENLEWATLKEQVDHQIRTGLLTSEMRRNCKGSKPVYQYDKEMNLIAVYPSMREAERQTKVHIKGIMDGIKYGWKFGGFVWKSEPIS